MKKLPDTILEALVTKLLWFDVKLEDIRTAWNNANGDEQVADILTSTYDTGFGTRQWFIDGTTEAMTEAWGPRCSDFEPDCSCCQAWAEFDDYLTR